MFTNHCFLFYALLWLPFLFSRCFKRSPFAGSRFLWQTDAGGLFVCFFSAKVRFHLVWSKGLEREETDRRGGEGSVTVWAERREASFRWEDRRAMTGEQPSETDEEVLSLKVIPGHRATSQNMSVYSYISLWLFLSEANTVSWLVLEVPDAATGQCNNILELAQRSVSLKPFECNTMLFYSLQMLIFFFWDTYSLFSISCIGLISCPMSPLSVSCLLVQVRKWIQMSKLRKEWQRWVESSCSSWRTRATRFTRDTFHH